MNAKYEKGKFTLATNNLQQQWEKQGGWFGRKEGRERREKGEGEQKKKKTILKMVYDNCIFIR